MVELVKVETKLDEIYTSRRTKRENEAINKLKTNPTYFYSYAKRFSKTNNQLGQLLKKDGTVVTDSFEKAELLREQYESMNSKPKSEFIVNDPDAFFEVVDSGNETQDEESEDDPTTEGLDSGNETETENTDETEEVEEEDVQHFQPNESEADENMPSLDDTIDDYEKIFLFVLSLSIWRKKVWWTPICPDI